MESIDLQSMSLDVDELWALTSEFNCSVTWTRYRCGMNHADQSQASTDRSLATVEKRHAELLRLRDEVEQLSCKLRQMYFEIAVKASHLAPPARQRRYNRP